MIHERSYSGPSDMLAMCALCIALRRSGLGAEHTGDLNWAAYMHSSMNPERDTRLWWDGASLAAWATWNTYGLTFALSHARRHDIDLLRRLVAWAVNQARTISPESGPPDEFRTFCFASHLPHARMLAELGFVPDGKESLVVTTRSLSAAIPGAEHPAGVVIRPPEGDDEIDRRAQLHAAVWHPSRVTPAGYRITRAAPGYDPTLDMVALLPDGTMGAYCICWPEPATGTCEFEPVGTHPDHRRKGLAGAVMYAAMRRARETGLHTATVYCKEENLQFYESLGFAPVDRVIAHAKRFEDVSTTAPD